MQNQLIGATKIRIENKLLNRRFSIMMHSRVSTLIHKLRHKTMMNFRPLLLLASVFLVTQGQAQEHLIENAQWRSFFDSFNAEGTMVVLDQRGKQQAELALQVFNPERASARLSPASTFKIPHTLFALDSGAIADEFQVFEWDGVVRSYAPHNQDQDLRAAIRNSALWVFEIIAGEIGEPRAKTYLERIQYGNANPSSDAGAYWVEGELAISAIEQVEFLRRLFYNELPFKKEHQLLLKDVLVVEAGRDWILRAKTGFQGAHGWWVGWVEWPDGPVFFALNIDTPNGMEDTYKREAIATEILQSLQALP